MRRLVVVLALGLALVVPATAGASTTIGSTYNPGTVRVHLSSSGDSLLVHFIAADLAVRNWALVLRTRSSSYVTMSDWDASRICSMTGKTDDRSSLPTGIPAEVLDFHMMTTLWCTDDATNIKARVQIWHQQEPDFGTRLDGNAPYTINVSVLTGKGRSWIAIPNPTQPDVSTGWFDLPPIGQVAFDGAPVLQAATRWSKFSPNGYQGYLKGEHFQTLYGSFTYGGAGVWGPGDRGGKPTNQFGRNVYIDTYNSDFGKGWRRVVGVLSQQPNGSYCYEFSPKGGSKGKTGAGTVYTVTAQGPGLAPDQRTYFLPPTFAFGNDVYNAKADKWGTNFSDGEAQALRNQALQMGPDFRRKVKGTDCAEQLRQLPDSFFSP